ncbi:MAG: NACHT domain-containing protein, partial [Spirulinaceae cyanobacterium]
MRSIWQNIWEGNFPELDVSWSQTAETSMDVIVNAKNLLQAIESNKDAQAVGRIAAKISCLLDIVVSPWSQVLVESFPFLKLAIEIIKYFNEKGKAESIFQDSVLVISQAAYLESLNEIMKAVQESPQKEPHLLSDLLRSPASSEIRKEINDIGKDLNIDGKKLTFDKQEADKVLYSFHQSALAQIFNLILSKRLEEAMLPILEKEEPNQERQAYIRRLKSETKKYTEFVARNTHRLIQRTLASMADDPISGIARYIQGDFKIYQSIDRYLEEQICYDTALANVKKQWIVFRENFSIKDIYVSLKAKYLDKSGKPTGESFGLQERVLFYLQDPGMQDKVVFIEGDPGRGKSAFCKMFANYIGEKLKYSWIPILIKLKDVDLQSGSIEDILRNATDSGFASDLGWLKNPNTRYLFLLDGFDDLLMQNKINYVASFIRDISDFQVRCSESTEKEHRFVITGRTFAVDIVERDIKENIERIQIQPFSQKQQQKWIGNWAKCNNSEVANQFARFLQDINIPPEVNSVNPNKPGLAQEPLLLYLLAVMHKHGKLSGDMFSGGAASIKKIKIYSECIRWVLDEQTPYWLEKEDRPARQFVLTELGLCCSRSSRGCSSIEMLKSRVQDHPSLRGENNRVPFVISGIQKHLSQLDSFLLSSFVKKTRSSDSSEDTLVEFTHKTFAEYLCSKRFVMGMEKWVLTYSDSYECV